MAVHACDCSTWEAVTEESLSSGSARAERYMSKSQVSGKKAVLGALVVLLYFSIQQPQEGYMYMPIHIVSVLISHNLSLHLVASLLD